MFVRTAGERDLPAVSQLLAEVWHHTYDAFYGAEDVEAVIAKRYSRAALRESLHRDRSEFLVADDGSAIAGMAFAEASGDDARVVMLHQIYVRPKQQGYGIGGLLLEEIEQSFFESELMRVEVEDRNARATAFFQTQGYVPVASRTLTVSTMTLFEKSLLPSP